MKRHMATGSMGEWKRWLLALTLCVFALAYGAPASLAAHARMPHAAMEAGCPSAAGRPSNGAAKSDPGGSAACCVAHCLPAAPAPLPAETRAYAGGGEEPAPRDEGREGQAVPVLLPPPRT